MANFPTSVSTNANLYIAVNGLQTTLAANILSTDTTIQLTSTTSFPTAGFVTIENNEVVSYTGISGANLTGCTRGADGTTALAHNTGVTVGATVVAAHHNLLKDEVIAIETALGAGYAQTSANTAHAVVQRDGSGNFAAGTITASLTGAASSNLLKVGDTMTGDLTMSNQKGVIFNEQTGNGTDSVKVEAPDDVTTSYTIKLPPAVASAGQVLTDAAGNGVLSWSSPGTGTVTNVSGTTNQITSTNPTTTPVLALANPLTLPGAMTAGGNIAMASNKITGLAAATASGDALSITSKIAVNADGYIKGTIIQTVASRSTSANDGTSSSTFVDTSTAIAFTPLSSTSKISITITGVGNTGNGNTTNGVFTIFGTTSGNLGDTTNGLAQVLGNSASAFYNQFTMIAVDTPGTVSAQTYKVRFRSSGGASVAWGVGVNVSWIIQEVAA